MDQVLLHATRWINLTNIMLSEKVKHKIGLFGFIYINFRNKQINLLEIRMEVA